MITLALVAIGLGLAVLALWGVWAFASPAPPDCPTPEPYHPDSDADGKIRGRYYGREEILAAQKLARARSLQGGDDAGEALIDYPECADCGKRHPPQEWLDENKMAVCKRCGRVAVRRRSDHSRPVEHRNRLGRKCWG